MNIPRRIPLVLSFALAACSPPVSNTDAQADAPADAQADVAAPSDVAAGACTAKTRTCAEVMATFISDATDVQVTCDATAGTFTIRSMGVPNYVSNQTTPNAIRDQGWIATVPLTPTCAASTTDVVNSRGQIGFMINGVPFYGPQDANGGDAVLLEGPTFDDCEGHADPGCSYHYHAEPICVFGQRDTSAMHTLADGHPPVIGYALDGFAIYASNRSGSSDPPLDGCNGHTDATRGYHYHATSTSPYLIGCYRGTPAGQVQRTMNLCTNGQPQDGGVGDSGTMTPRACTTTAECTNACPPGSMGCTCALGMSGSKVCVPSCNVETDCPSTPMGMLHCDTTAHTCHP